MGVQDPKYGLCKEAILSFEYYLSNNRPITDNERYNALYQRLRGNYLISKDFKCRDLNLKLDASKKKVVSITFTSYIYRIADEAKRLNVLFETVIKETFTIETVVEHKNISKISALDFESKIRNLILQIK